MSDPTKPVGAGQVAAAAQAPMRPTALLALWNDVDPAQDAAYNEWHSVEHVPQRCTVPGILWGRRYRTVRPDAGPRYLTLYGLRDPEVLDSEPYRRLLREPTPASRAMRPALRNVSRWVCRLHQGGDPGAATRLLVATPPDEPRPDPAIDALAHDHGVSSLLVAERLRSASPLPWLAAEQEKAQEGIWLLCAALGDAADLAADTRVVAVAPAAPATILYRRLPVAGA